MGAVAFWSMAFIGVRELMLLAAAGIALASLDDLFIDSVYLVRRAWRRLTVYTRNTRATADRLPARDAGWMAILIPAWDEAPVIGLTLRLMLRRLDHPRYRIFVGIYPNDPETAQAVQLVDDDRIIIATGTRPGPTTKADCLNLLWGAMCAHEQAHDMRFKAVVLHDAEDIVHSRELAVFDHLIPRRAMVQLPVMPIREKWARWIAGHYIDEFAEHHGKDMVVREALGAGLPSAGVACAFDRDLLARAVQAGQDGPFNAGSLTEDYELGMRLRALGGHGVLVRIRGQHGGGHVVTREYFPATLETALRQKSRWLLGIALMGWDDIGWRGSLADRYMLLRDRKALLTALLSMLGYVAAIGWVGTLVVRWLLPEARALPAMAPAGGLLWLLLLFNAGALVWRLAMRAAFTGRLYGPGEALLSIPRAVVGNIINFLAARRAIARYIRIRTGRETLVWDKTAHHSFTQAPAE